MLLFEYDRSTCVGAPEYGSDRFFNECDVPPWDTWVGELSIEHRDVLIAWVPPEFVALAIGGIEEDAYGLFHWADKQPFPNFDTAWMAASG